MTPKDVLRKAADLIEEAGWTRGTYARDAEGKPCYFDSKLARCYCANGAMQAVTARSESDKVYREAYDLLCKRLGVSFISEWNDSLLTSGEVVRALREVAET